MTTAGLVSQGGALSGAANAETHEMPSLADIRLTGHEAGQGNEPSHLDSVWFTFEVVPNTGRPSAAAAEKSVRGYTIRRRYRNFYEYSLRLSSFFADQTQLLRPISQDLKRMAGGNGMPGQKSLSELSEELGKFVRGILTLTAVVINAKPSVEFFGIWPTDLAATGNCVAFTNAVGEAWTSSREIHHPRLNEHHRSRSVNEMFSVPWVQRTSLMFWAKKKPDAADTSLNRSDITIMQHTMGSKESFVDSRVGRKPYPMDRSAMLRETAGMRGHQKSSSLSAIGKIARALNRRRVDGLHDEADSSQDADDISWPINASADFAKTAGVSEEDAFDAAALVEDYTQGGLEAPSTAATIVPPHHTPSLPTPYDRTSKNSKSMPHMSYYFGNTGMAHEQSSRKRNGPPAVPPANGKDGSDDEDDKPLGVDRVMAAPAAKFAPYQRVISYGNVAPTPPPRAPSRNMMSSGAGEAIFSPDGVAPTQPAPTSCLSDEASAKDAKTDLLCAPKASDNHNRRSDVSDLLDLYEPLKNRDPTTTIEDLLSPLPTVTGPVDALPDCTIADADSDEIPLKISIVQWRFKKPLQIFVPRSINYTTLYEVLAFELRKRREVVSSTDDNRIMVWTVPTTGQPRRIVGDRTLQSEIAACGPELRIRCEPVSKQRPTVHRRSRSVPLVGPAPKQARWRGNTEFYDPRSLAETAVPELPARRKVGGKTAIQRCRSPSAAGRIESVPPTKQLSVEGGVDTMRRSASLPKLDVEHPQRLPPSKVQAGKHKRRDVAPMRLSSRDPNTGWKHQSAKRKQHRRTSSTPSAKGVAAIISRAGAAKVPSVSGSSTNTGSRSLESSPSSNDVKGTGIAGYGGLALRGHGRPPVGFEEHRRQRSLGVDTNASQDADRPAAPGSGSSEVAQAVRFRVKKSAGFDDLQAAVWRTLARQQLPAEALAGRTLVFRCPDGTDIPLTDDNAVASAFKRCNGKLTLTCV
ncbi:hypothetical protein THASP1DRAFT_25207 [Thamnocephalis sphaerospora]|uniref:PX domain-containing protein n=1 Tax=Thamnocephalis sphaerospora TaxID=78915 RepID=A0A4P9XM90_9FUNG|nr:hypothetical protein THASP1DRAFT_25749 [Thamnocephalis sphaerospora]RKP06481.1 hypothetical protein THASP1DRAFT_25207 [Thamnocephalis sphaerospora]|eukprot:RKP05822.1 hypothetical protein THASP1DRAFT_25749 [Thamnocephalis sphaerospora]